MLNYKSVVSSKTKVNSADLPITAKNHCDEFPPKSHPIHNNLKNPTRYTQRLQHVKNDINSLITQVDQKRSQNTEAVEKVRAVNTELLAMMHGGNQVRRSMNQGSGYGRGSTQQYDGNQQSQTIDAQFQHPNGSITLDQENEELRRELNNQIKLNNKLLRRTKFLEASNEDLRNQLGIAMYDSKGMPSTNYNSVANGDASNHMDYSPIQKSSHPPHLLTDTNMIPNCSMIAPGRVYMDSNQDYHNNNSTSNSNYEKNPHANQNLGNNNTSRINTLNDPRKIMGELDDLKKENEKLRLNAIDLLRSAN